jgi:hypothetical protein
MNIVYRYSSVKKGYKTSIKHKALPVSEKLKITKKADAQPRVMCTKVTEQLSIPMSTPNNIIANKRNLLQCVTAQPSRRKVKTF